MKEIHLERLLLGRKPGELLELQGRLDRLDSDNYKSKVADQLPNSRRTSCYEGKTLSSASSKESTLLLVSESKRRAEQNVGGRCYIQS